MILNNVNLLTFWPSRPFVAGALVAIEGKSIVDFDRVGKLIDRYEHPTTLDLGGRIVVPGCVDAFREPSRVLGLDVEPGAPAWSKELDGEALYVSGVVSILDALRSGTTSVLAFDSGVSGTADGMLALRRAFEDTGVRGSVAVAAPGLSPSEELLESQRRIASESNEMFCGAVALDVTADTTDAEISLAIDTAHKGGGRLHIRASAERVELDRSLERFDSTPVERLASLGALTLSECLVYAPWRTPSDEDLVRESGARLVLSPASEMLAGVPTPKLASTRAKETRVAVGTAAAGGGILGAACVMALREASRGMDLKSAVRLSQWAAFREGAELASRRFGPPLGQIRPGARADLVVLDRTPRLELDEARAPDELFNALVDARVYTTIVNGRILYHNGGFVSLDEQRFRARALEIATRLSEHI